jgi:hypothetical protein
MRNHSVSSNRLRFTQQEREKLIVKYRASGLAQREFAQEQGIKVGTLRQWIYRPRSPLPMARGKKFGFQEVSISEVPFLNGWAAELQLPRGVALRLNSNASVEWIGALVQKLGQVC